MQEFKYIVRRSVFIPESITVAGMEFRVNADEDEYTMDDGKYYPPKIEYDGDIPVSDDEFRWFNLTIEYHKIKEQFYCCLMIDGEKIVEDTVCSDDVSRTIDRFVETAEDLLRV